MDHLNANGFMNACSESDVCGTLVLKFEEKPCDIDIKKKITVSHCRHIACTYIIYKSASSPTMG